MDIFEYKLIIRESLLDIYGHVNNAAYITLFEEARWEFVTKRGCGINEILKSGVGPIILSLKTSFRKELRARDQVRISVEMLKFKHKVGLIRQKILKENGDLACEGEFEFGIFDGHKRKLIEPDKKWRYALGIDSEID